MKTKNEDLLKAKEKRQKDVLCKHVSGHLWILGSCTCFLERLNLLLIKFTLGNFVPLLVRWHRWWTRSFLKKIISHENEEKQKYKDDNSVRKFHFGNIYITEIMRMLNTWNRIRRHCTANLKSIHNTGQHECSVCNKVPFWNFSMKIRVLHSVSVNEKMSFYTRLQE